MGRDRLVIISSRAVSLLNVSKLVAEVSIGMGVKTVIYDAFIGVVDLAKIAKAALFVQTFDPIVAANYIYTYYTTRPRLEGNAIYYTLSEGRIKSYLVASWMKTIGGLVANSQYSKAKLEEAGFNVDKVIHHGYPDMLLGKVKTLARKYREELKKQTGGKTLIGLVARNDPRKCLDLFANAVRIVESRRDDFALLVLVPRDAQAKFKDLKTAVIVGDYGRQDYVQVLAFIASLDWLVMPSCSESFGLPVLEANYVGVPVVAVKHPAFIEYADRSANIFIEPSREGELDAGYGIIYEMFYYEPEEMAKAISEAIDIARDEKDYQSRRKTVASKVSVLKASKQYKELLSLLEL